MNGQSSIVKMGFEPGFQLILIVSALMHILAIALVTNPFGLDEKVEDSYFVKLVMPEKIKQQPKTVLKKTVKAKPQTVLKKTELIKQKTVVKVKPKKKQEPAKKTVKAKPPEVSVKSIEKKSIKKSYTAKKQSSKATVPLAKNRSLSGNTVAIKIKSQGNIAKYNGDAPAMDRTGRGSNFKAKTDTAQQGKMIAGKGVSDRKEYKAVSRGVREQSFASMSNENNEQHMIEQDNRVVENLNVPVKKAVRDSMYAAAGQREEPDDNQYEISRSEEAIQNEAIPEYPESDNVEYPETDFSNNGLASEAGNEGGPAISQPAAAAGSMIKKGSYSPKKEQVIKDNEQNAEKKVDDRASSEMSIPGVPLDDLNACTNALDERTLKKKILNVIGDKKECYSQDDGEYLFLGTARFASFDMKIIPRTGRKLSNRCEELRNAFQCLTLK